MGKVQAELRKNAKILHPNSRKAKKLSRKLNRESLMMKKKAFSNLRLQLLGERLIWFKDNFDSSCKIYTHEDMEDLIYRYINWNAEEMEAIRNKHKIGHRKFRQHAPREDLIRINMENDLKDFNGSGLETVNLTDEENVKAFKLWNGELRFIQNLKLIQFKARLNRSTPDDTVMESTSEVA